MFPTRMFRRDGTVVICCGGGALPSGANQQPPVAAGDAVPVVQKREPSSLAALRMLPASYAALSAVLVSMFPFISTRATMRFTDADNVVATPGVPGDASYPARAR